MNTENFADKSTWRRNYIGVRNMRWDGLWHAIFKTTTESGKKVESWNRITKEDAMILTENL
jgi:hypothetical protein